MRAGNVCHSETFDAEESSSAKTLRAVYPEQEEKMLRCAQHDSKRRAQGDRV